ncbi:MAG: OOP family OmpA-OmpF porin [Cyclobacteriaceae bacterium]|jgi:OOP family OmpA-OmpF porin
MRILECVILIGVLSSSYHSVQAQVTFYSNTEPVLKLNSSDAESYLYLSAEGSELIYTKEKSSANIGGKQNSGDVWFANLLDKSPIDSGFTRTFNSSDVFNSPLGYTPDKRYFLYNETSLSQGMYKGQVMALSIATGKKVQVDIPYFQNSSQLQSGFLSRDGKYLILSLENNTGFGVEDLYVSIQNQEGKWSAPKNLGFSINTDRQEITPFLAADNKTLYFATNARGGLGSFDIYFATRLDDSWKNWSEPQNLGSMVNSEGSETSFMFNSGAEYAYFISTQNSDGYGDIKRIRIYPTLEGVPNDTAISEQILIVEPVEYEKRIVFKVKNAKTDEELAFTYAGRLIEDDLTTSINSYNESVTEVEFGFNDEDSLSLEFKSKGFLSASVSITFDELEGGINQQIITLEPLETGRTITFKHVLFDRGTSNFIGNSVRELDLVVEMMNDNPDVKILLKGHTDNFGNKVLNIQLSQARVNAVRDYLVAQGIEKSKISGKGFGGSKPIADNRNEETRKLNRRVEFEVIRD